MFMFDVETLGTESNSVLLSLACIHFDPKTKPTYQELKDSAFFVKFSVRDQVDNYKRKVSKDAIRWWDKQCLNAKNWSYIPDKSDKPLLEGLQDFHAWVASKDDGKCFLWARGSLDDIILQACERQAGLEPIFNYGRFRDVRTAIDIFYNSNNGYCDVDHPNFLSERDVTKHNPIDDCAFDIMMLVYGKEKT